MRGQNHKNVNLQGSRALCVCMWEGVGDLFEVAVALIRGGSYLSITVYIEGRCRERGDRGKVEGVVDISGEGSCTNKMFDVDKGRI